ncbi:MAG: tetratricopeptide repeat protein [Desulfobacterales bacterium]|nr:tetratricopeptide repeat protein [Desulfobacterales bacterium]
MASRKWRLFICLITICGLTACAAGDLALRKERATASRELGEVYMSQESYTRALREFLKAEQIYAKDPFLQNDLGLAYMAKKQYDKAISHFKYALELNPDYAPARNNLGAAYMENEDWDAAIECFEAVKDDLLYATPHFPLTNLGFIAYHKGNYEQAVHYYKEALDLMPGFPKALHGLGQVYLDTSRPDKAVEVLEKAVDKAPGQTRIHLDLGKAYRDIHEYNKAYKTFKKAAAMGKDTRLGEEAERLAEEVWRFE